MISKENFLSGMNRCFLGRRSVSLVQTDLLWEEEGVVFPQLIITFWEDVDLPHFALQVPLSMIALTAVKNRDNEVYSVTTS
jgi:hypothetical protein